MSLLNQIVTKDNIVEIINRKMGFTPSFEQTDAIVCVVNGFNVSVSAEAGSGKTTLAKMITEVLLDYNPSIRILYIAFTNNAKEEAMEKFDPRIHIRTTHQVGLAIMKSLYGNVQMDKYNKIKSSALKKFGLDKDYEQFASLYMNYNQSIEDFALTLQKFYGHGPQNAMHYAKMGEMLAIEMVRLFDEQITNNPKHAKYAPFDLFRYIPVIRNGKLKAGDVIGPINEGVYYPGEYDIVLFDEAQDANNISIKLLDGLKFKQFACFGQIKQAIFLFAGSNYEALPMLSDKYNCQYLPLNETRRCTKQMCEFINSIMVNTANGMEPLNDKIWSRKEGEPVETIRENDMYSWIGENYTPAETTTIITRKTVDAIAVFMQLLQRQIPAYLKGVDIKNLCETVIKWLQKINKEWDLILNNIPVYRQRMFDRNDDEIRYVDWETFDDWTQAFARLYNEALAQNQCLTENQFIQWLDKFIEQKTGICVGVAHRMKGDEYDNCFIYDYNSWPYSFKDQTDAQMEQEQNLLFVAATRGRELLKLVIL